MLSELQKQRTLFSSFIIVMEPLLTPIGGLFQILH